MSNDNDRISISIAQEVFEKLDEERSEFETWNGFLMRLAQSAEGDQ